MVQNAEYQNAATVEFIVDKDNNFYFIEVNARIQVEHTISEMVTGIDLIEQQIRVASGEKLAFKQKDIPCNGVSIECRINAEHPRTFAPSPGKVVDFHAPGGMNTRLDSALYAGYSIPPYYDSLIGKLIVWGNTREGAILRLRRALGEMVISGVQTTIPLHEALLDDPEFQKGEYNIHWLEKWLEGQE